MRKLAIFIRDGIVFVVLTKRSSHFIRLESHSVHADRRYKLPIEVGSRMARLE